MTTTLTRTRSVLQDWVTEIPLRAQGTLLTAVRGCDLTPKYPLDSFERELVGFIRWCFMIPADPREVGVEPGCFFIPRPPRGDVKPSALGHYPWHWISHIVHALEVIAYCCPEKDKRIPAYKLYAMFVHSFHMNMEEHDQFVERITEDRIALGAVVS